MKTAGIRRPALLLLAVTAAILSLGVAVPVFPASGTKGSEGEKGPGAPVAPLPLAPHPEMQSPSTLNPDAGSKPSSSRSGKFAPDSGSGGEARVFKPEEHTTESPLPLKPATDSNPIKFNYGEPALAPGSRDDGPNVDHTAHPLNLKLKDHTEVRAGLAGGQEPLDDKLGHVTHAQDHTERPLSHARGADRKAVESSAGSQ